MFGSDGRLYPAVIAGTASIPRTAQQGCWPERSGRVVVNFAAPSSIVASELRVGYIWYPKVAGAITVYYGKTVRIIAVKPGLHSAYMSVAGSASKIVVSSLGGNKICVGDAEAGTFMQAQAGPVIPPVSR
jgi:hypothetical protein